MLSNVLANAAASNRVFISNGSGKLTTSLITSVELEYLDDCTSTIQTQIDSINTSKVNNTDFTLVQTLANTLSTSCSINSLNITELDAILSTTILNNYTKVQADEKYYIKYQTNSNVIYEIQKLYGTLSDYTIGLVMEFQPGLCKLFINFEAPNIYNKTDIDNLLVNVPIRIIETHSLTKIKGGSGGVQLLSPSDLLLEASSLAVSSLKPLIGFDTLTVYGDALKKKILYAKKFY